MSEKTTFKTLKTRKTLYENDRLYQVIDPVLSLYLSRTAADLSNYETLMFYSFCVICSIG